MQLVVNSLLTNYRRSGKAGRPIVLLLHGWGDTTVSWAGLERALTQGKTQAFDVIAPDMPGFGGSQAPPTDWDLRDYADFVGAFLQKLNIKKVHAVIGHSNGGAIAVRGLANHAFEADRLILLASAGIRRELQGRKKLLRAATKAGKVLTYPLPRAMRKRLRKQLYTSVGSDFLIAEHMQGTFKKIVTDDIQNDAAKLTLPTLLIYGEDDLAAPVHYGRILHNLIAGSRLETIAGAGHFVHHDAAEQTDKLVVGFVSPKK